MKIVYVSNTCKQNAENVPKKCRQKAKVKGAELC